MNDVDDGLHVLPAASVPLTFRLYVVGLAVLWSSTMRKYSPTPTVLMLTRASMFPKLFTPHARSVPLHEPPRMASAVLMSEPSVSTVSDTSGWVTNRR